MELLSTSQREAEDLTDIVDRETEKKAYVLIINIIHIR